MDDLIRKGKEPDPEAHRYPGRLQRYFAEKMYSAAPSAATGFDIVAGVKNFRWFQRDRARGDRVLVVGQAPESPGLSSR